MPITLKLSRPSRPATTAAVGDAKGYATPAESGTASPSRRTVSFSGQQQHSSTDPYDASTPSPTPFKTAATAEWYGGSTSTSSAPSQRNFQGSTMTKPFQAPPRPPTPPRRPRSPTPPSSAYALARPLTKPKASLRKHSSLIAQSMTRLITRYAYLAGYTAIEPSALDYLQESVRVYVESVLLQGLESALLGGRTDLTIRDVLGAMYCGDDEDGVDESEARNMNGNSDTMPTLHPLTRYVSQLITWRHNVPDDYDELPTDSPDEVNPAWLTDSEAGLLLHSSAVRISDEGNDEHLLSRKSRYLEKSRREEIPAHLPELPEVHTWRRSANDAGGDAPTSTILSRLEARLVSSRLVQSSLRSLIGRLNEANHIDMSSAINASLQPDAQNPSEALTTKDAPGSNIPSPAGSGTPLSRSGNRPLSARLRTQSTHEAVSAADDEPDLSSEPLPKRRRGLSEYDQDLHLDFRGQPRTAVPASPQALATPTSATPITSFHFPPRRANAVASSALSTPGVGQSGGSAGGYPWSNPLLSPVTPLSAGMSGAKYFSAALSGTLSHDALEGHRFPALSTSGPGGGGDGDSLSSSAVVLPPIVNFKASWYAKKV